MNSFTEVQKLWMKSEKRIKYLNDWVRKSKDKYNNKFYDFFENHLFDIDELKIFIDRSVQISKIYNYFIEEDISKFKIVDLYFKSDEDILIYCPQENHGFVCITPYQHISKSNKTGCTKCSGKYVRTQEEFDHDLKKINGDSITRLEPYINQTTPMKMNCKKHGELPYKKTGKDLICGKQGCPSCVNDYISELKKKNIEKWMSEINDFYPIKFDDYSNMKLEYIDGICIFKNIKCINHDKPYDQRAQDYIRGHRCRDCKYALLSKIHRIDYINLIERFKIIHIKENYTYPSEEPVNYKNGYSLIPVICNKTFKNGDIHGIWYPTAHNHLQGSKCPACNPVGFSRISLECLTFLSDSLNIHIQHKENGGEFKILDTRYYADGFSKDFNCIFEFHGCYFHGCKKCYSDRERKVFNNTHDENLKKTYEKKYICIEKGYKYIEIWECEWYSFKNNQEQLLNYVKSILNIN